MTAADPTLTTCPYCGVGCGVKVSKEKDGTFAVSGDPNHPANFGRLCSKGSALGETLGLDGRLLYPQIGGRRAHWNEALDLVAERFSETIWMHGPDAVAFYVSGQLLTEDYYVANKLMKGFIGSANIDTNSRLCMASSVAGHKRAFGSDTVPGTYEDLDEADLVVLVGSNLAWCHPVLYQRLVAARERRGTIIVAIDPRRTATAEGADLHLPVKPGGDIPLFNGLLGHLWSVGAVDRDFVEHHADGLAETLDAAGALGFDGVVRETGLDAELLRRFYDLFARTDRVVTVYSQGVNQSVVGTDKVNAIINCHLLTGRIGTVGAGPFSVTGQPNAMGGREVGGLANQLAAHMSLEDPEHRRIVRNVWKAPRIADRAGLKAVDMFRAVADGRIKAIWIMATNPVDSMPDADRVRQALIDCPFVVVSDVARNTDTAACADVLLPAAAWGEKDGTVTNSERRISRQRRFRPPPGEARPDWWIVAEIGRRMGFGAAFDFTGPAAVFREHAALSAVGNSGSRDFDLGGLSDISEADYAAMAPVQWPVPRVKRAGGRFFGDRRFFTVDQRARFVPIWQERGGARSGGRYPLILNSGRVRDHWHTMTRTGQSPRLSAHIAEPFVEINPADARAAGIGDAELVAVESRFGSAVVRALISSAQQAGTVFMPMHWTDQFASSGRVDALVEPATDPHSGQPGLKSGRVAIRRFAAAWYGFAVLRDRPAKIDADYWAVARTRGGWRVELAGLVAPPDWTAFAASITRGYESHELVAYEDAKAGIHRFAAFDGNHIAGALFVAPQPVAVSRAFAAKQLEEDLPPEKRMAFLAGRPGAATPDIGAIVCSCFEIGANQIAGAIESGRCLTVVAVGEALSAGTNCGSCRPEIQRIIDARAPAPPPVTAGAMPQLALTESAE